MQPVTIYHNAHVMVDHRPPAGAPEEPKRIVAIEAVLKGHTPQKIFRAWREIELLGADIEIPTEPGSIWSRCQSVHVNDTLSDAAVVAEYSEKVVRHVKYNTPKRGSKVDPKYGDTFWSTGTWMAAKTAAAAAIEATEAALADPHGRPAAFCIVRPPGHHCFDVPAGFCILNNVVLAARRVLAAGKRVAIVDWDYHYGDGTAAALWGEEGAMVVSLHAAFQRDTKMPTYPALTRRNFKGDGLRRATDGRCFNIQWVYDDADDAAFAYAFQHAILPALRRFAPDVILISAGYDAIKGDDLAGMEMTPAAFGFAAAALTGLNVPVVAVLEGGYNVDLLAEGVAHTVLGLQRDPAIMAQLDIWLQQTPAPHHVEVVNDIAVAVL